jgi:hypothetical protein
MVDKIEPYFMAADVFLNPILSGGGIKTKLVEAIGFGASAVSTVTGAMGCGQQICGNKLTIVKDGDWKNFDVGKERGEPRFELVRFYHSVEVRLKLGEIGDKRCAGLLWDFDAQRRRLGGRRLSKSKLNGRQKQCRQGENFHWGTVTLQDPPSCDNRVRAPELRWESAPFSAC